MLFSYFLVEYKKKIRGEEEILREIALEWKIAKIVEVLKIYLNNLSNRDLYKPFI